MYKAAASHKRITMKGLLVILVATLITGSLAESEPSSEMYDLVNLLFSYDSMAYESSWNESPSNESPLNESPSSELPANEAPSKESSSSESSSNESSSEAFFEYAKVARLMQRMCLEHTGNNETYRHLEALANQLPRCISSYMDFDEFEQELENLSYQTQTPFLLQTCPKVIDIARNCVDEVTSLAAQCLDATKLRLLGQLEGIVSRAIDLLCSDKRKLFRKPFASFSQCSYLVSNCWEDYSDWMDCESVTESRSCVQERLFTCGAPKLNELYGLFNQFVLLVKHQKCGMYKLDKYQKE